MSALAPAPCRAHRVLCRPAPCRSAGRAARADLCNSIEEKKSDHIQKVRARLEVYLEENGRARRPLAYTVKRPCALREKILEVQPEP